jgi:general secretion pathway protein D
MRYIKNEQVAAKMNARPTVLTSIVAMSGLPLFLQLALLTHPVSSSFAQEKTTSGNALTPSSASPSSDEAELNVRNAEIGALIRIFSKRTKRNYLLDERVKGKVTMYIPGKLSPEESIKILDSILALKGFTTVPVGQNLWKIIPAKEARQATVPLLDDAESEGRAAAIVSRVVPLAHVSADEVQPLVGQLISADGFASVFGGSNSLLIIDYEDNSERIRKLLETLDVPMMNRDMTIIPIQNAEAGDIAEKLRELLGIGDGQSGGGAGLPGVQSTARGQMGQPFRGLGAVPPGQPSGVIPAVDGQPLGGAMVNAPRKSPPQLIADERTNSIIVVADDEMTTRIKALISELDSKVDLSGNRFYIYRCQHAKAEDLAAVLGGLAGGTGAGSSGGGGSSRQAAGSGLGGGGASGSGAGLGGQGLGGGMFGGSGINQRGRSSLGTGGTQGGALSGAGTPRQSASVQLNESTSITADPATNTLIIQSNRSDYEKIRSLIDSLDIKRRQVLVEAMLLEVSVDNTQTTGIDFLTSTGGDDGGVLAQNQLGGSQGLQGLLADPRSLAGFSIAAASRGSLTLPGDITIPTQAVMLTAARSNQNVNVLSAPTLLATDNEPAEIVVGQNVPFLASTSTNQTNLNNTFNQIDRQDVGITLRLTPQISSEDFVTLNIFTNVSDLVATANSDLGPTTTVRSSQTTVITKDGQMIVIGGLMADQNNDADSGVPFLKDIPILGSAFRRNTERRVRTNLLTFITPHVVKDQFDARDQTIDRRDKIKGVIEQVDSEPKRTELLDNPDIDNVPEVERGEFVAPGTIQGPATRGTLSDKSGTNERLNSDSARSDRSLGSSDRSLTKQAPREVRVAPRLPSVTTMKPSSVGGDPSEKRGASAFLILRVLKGNFSPNSPLKPIKGVVAIKLPQGTPASAHDFFALGRRVVFDDPQGPVTLEVVEQYPTAESGSSEGPLRTGDWRSISPFELMRLGQGPWRSEAAKR